MREFMLAALTSTLLFGTALAADKPVANDKKNLQGTWDIVTVEIEKKPLAMDSLTNSILVIKGDRYSFTLNDTHLEITFKLFPDQKPKAIDLVVAEGAEKGQVYHGIYKLEGNTYTICRTTEPGKPRPKDFFTEPGSGHMMVVWHRAKK